MIMQCAMTFVPVAHILSPTLVSYSFMEIFSGVATTFSIDSYNSQKYVHILLCLGGRSHEAYSSSFVYVCICLSVGRISRRSLKTKR